MTDTLYTIRQIADMAGVSKITAYRFIKTGNVAETKQDGTTKLYDETTAKAIVQGLKNRERATVTETTETPKDALILAKDEQIKTMQAHIELLTNQLNIKDGQIADLNNQLTTLSKLIDQQQQLNLQAQKMLTVDDEVMGKKAKANETAKKHWWRK